MRAHFKLIPLWVAFGLACNLLGRTAAPVGVPTDTGLAATPVFISGGNEEPSPEELGDDPYAVDEAPPPPGGFVEAIEAKVVAGDWSYEEGLLAGLRIFAGEADAEQLFGELTPAEQEGTGLILVARDYLASGTNPETKSEIERLLALIIPDIDRLLRYAQPAESQARRAAGLAAPMRQLLDCAELWAQGFPQDQTTLCFLYFEHFYLGMDRIRVFFPSDWLPNDPRRASAQYAKQAVDDSFQVYRALGQLGAVDVVFSLLPYPHKHARAATLEGGIGLPCKIIVYPLALTHAEGVFKQDIAHEVFHCFQGWNFLPQIGTNWKVNDWWGEGSAEYFSNVVYSAGNHEWQHNASFDARSPETSLLEMSYENWLFFQDLANRIGDAGVFQLVRSLPMQGTLAEQQAALSKFPNFQDLFHSFGQAYLTSNVFDTSQVPISTNPRWPSENQIQITGSASNLLETPTMVLTRYVVSFVPGKYYALQTSTSGGTEGRDSALAAAASASWAPLTTEVLANCDAQVYKVLLTSTSPVALYHELLLDVQAKEEIGCDRCLVGVWDMDKAAFLAMMSEAPDDDADNWIVEGNLQLRFQADGLASAKYQDFAISFTFDPGDLSLGGTILMESRFDGGATFGYWSDGAGTLHSIEKESDVSVKTYMNGGLVGNVPNLLDGVGAGTSSYVCSPSLLLMTPVLPEAPVTNLRYGYVRVSNQP